MAGKRQHYVPRLLQRGFLTGEAGEGERSWLHRRGMRPRPVGIGDIGVEDWFYSRKAKDGGKTLDDVITEYEDDLSTSVRALRGLAPGSEVGAQQAAETVVHLVIRTAHLRTLLSDGMVGIAREIEALFTDPARLGAMLGLAGPSIAGAAADSIRRTAADLETTGLPGALSERLLIAMMRELGDQLAAQIATSLGPLVPELLRELISKVSDAHRELVAHPLEGHGWVTGLATLRWTIEVGEDLILPDAVALAGSADGTLTPLLFTEGPEIAVVMMPIAADRMLVGRRGDAALDLAGFNPAAAAASENFFIAARSFEPEGLNDRIGSGPAKMLDAVISEAIREAQQTRSLSGSDLPSVRPQQLTRHGFSYSVTLADFGDAVLAREVGEIVHAVVASLARDLPLQDLDGITIAIDYDAALAGLDLGDPDLPSAKSEALGYGLGVAKPVTVMRDGRRKEHLVVAAGLADNWMSPDPAVRAEGLHILMKMLAGVAHTARYANARDISFQPDIMARAMHLAVAAAPNGYWSARQAAFVAPDFGQIYADLVIESFAYAEQEIAAERMRMADEADVVRAFTRGLECVSAILGHAADWLGHRDGLTEGQGFVGDDLPDRLKARGLDRWIALFGRDLAACYGADGSLAFDVITTLSRHVERLFWGFGLYCWPEADDIRCVVNDLPFRPVPFDP